MTGVEFATAIAVWVVIGGPLLWLLWQIRALVVLGLLAVAVIAALGLAAALVWRATQWWMGVIP